MNPNELLFAPTHEWAYIDRGHADKIATIGISAFAIEALTDLVYIELPEVGRNVQAGEAIGEIESVKAVSDIYSPVAGEIIEVNQNLVDQLQLLHDDPYGAGWVAKIRVGHDANVSNLNDFAGYQKQCEAEGH
jgi:glycine cleavage system H protein